MSEQQMANYTLTIQADSGYESTTEGRCTAKQYGQAMAALHGTSPAQRTWVGLTDEEKKLIERKHNLMYFDELFFDIEAKLKEKNT
jgi:hypothetical protein